MTIRSVLVDFGNVIAFFDHWKACRQLAALSSDQIGADELYAAIFETPFEADYDTGRVSTRACLAAAACPASACLYVDDRADFVAAGRALGLQTLVYSPGVDVEAATCY